MGRGTRSGSYFWLKLERCSFSILTGLCVDPVVVHCVLPNVRICG